MSTQALSEAQRRLLAYVARQPVAYLECSSRRGIKPWRMATVRSLEGRGLIQVSGHPNTWGLACVVNWVGNGVYFARITPEGLRQFREDLARRLIAEVCAEESALERAILTIGQFVGGVSKSRSL